jgi:hypothetical protein
MGESARSAAVTTLPALAISAVLAAASPAPSYHAQIFGEMQYVDQAVTQPATASKVLKAAVIAELAVDGLQTQAFLHSGRCHELDPLTRPFVHSEAIATVAVAGVAYLISRLPNRPWANALLGAFVPTEALIIASNARNCG